MPHRLVVFCVDGNAGLGHLVRCIALAQSFEARGHHSRFVGSAPDFLLPSIPGGAPIEVSDWARLWDDEVFRSEVASAALLVTDHYGIDETWQRKCPVPLLAITDPPLTRQHCDILLLPTSFSSSACGIALTAPMHSLIRSDIVYRRSRPKAGTRVLVSCGGGDDRGLAERIATAITSDAELARLPVTFVLGRGVSRTQIDLAIRNCVEAQVTSDVSDMAALIDTHDIAVGASGGSALERACLGLAQILVPIVDNQRELARGLSEAGAALTLTAQAGTAEIQGALRHLIEDQASREGIATSAFCLIDGRGADRVVDAVERQLF